MDRLKEGEWCYLYRLGEFGMCWKGSTIPESLLRTIFLPHAKSADISELRNTEFLLCQRNDEDTYTVNFSTNKQHYYRIDPLSSISMIYFSDIVDIEIRKSFNYIENR